MFFKKSLNTFIIGVLNPHLLVLLFIISRSDVFPLVLGHIFLILCMESNYINTLIYSYICLGKEKYLESNLQCKE